MAQLYFSKGQLTYGPRCYHTLSRKLYGVLEDVGATLENRKSFQLRSVATEIIQKECRSDQESPLGFKEHVFGSSYEGSCTACLKSDIDYVIILENIPVETEIVDKSREISLLLLENDSRPGYCKLQLVRKGEPVFGAANEFSIARNFLPIRLDKNNRSVVSLAADFVFTFAELERNGPAFSCPSPPKKHWSPMDFVYAFSSEDYPESATDFFNRKRTFNWPSSSALEVCKRMGCILVGKGHPKSDEQGIEWRISLSKQERFLVSQFNSVQLKCLILLKMIKKDVINKILKQKSLSSYHCKTCLLYLIENTPSEIWTPEHLLSCLDACLGQLSVWAEKGFCPNYFIPSENMFEGFISTPLMEKLRSLLKSLISSNSSYLLQIKCDNLRERLEKTLLGNMLDCAFERATWKVKDDYHMELHCHVVVSVLELRKEIIKNCFSANLEVFLKSLLAKMVQYRKISKGSKNKLTKEVLSLAIPYIDLCIMSNLIIYKVKQGKIDKHSLWQLLTSSVWQSLANKYDNVTFKLKQACLLHKFGYYDASLDILTTIENRMGYLHSICSCDEVPVVSHRLTPELNVSVEEHDFLNGCLAPCVIFLPTEESVTPWPLQCEWSRLREESLKPEDKDKYCWYDWAVVDAKFLLYFMFFLNHFKLGLFEYASRDADDMAHLLSHCEISHKETALNLLAWAMIYFGNSRDSAKCLKESLLIKPRYNAAKLLMGSCMTGTQSMPLYEFAAGFNFIWRFKEGYEECASSNENSLDGVSETQILRALTLD